MSTEASETPDVALIGAGILSATVGTLLKLLEPALDIVMLETLQDSAQESSAASSNAGTGHAGNCELNYTPRRSDGVIDIAEALRISAEFDISRQFWAYLVNSKIIPDPRAFIRPCPHLSFVWGEKNVAFLRDRYRTMSVHHCYRGMEYSEHRSEIADWIPLVMEGRGREQSVAATRMVTGTEINFGALTNRLVERLEAQPRFSTYYNHEVVGLDRLDDGRWSVTVRQVESRRQRSFRAKAVLVGAGGGALKLLHMSKIPEGRGCGGFAISGRWLRCDSDEVNMRQDAKVYSTAAKGSPSLPSPHLDTRIIEAQRSLLFGPFARLSGKLIEHGYRSDLLRSIEPASVQPMLAAARSHSGQAEYLIGQSLQTSAHRFALLRQFVPRAEHQTWHEAEAAPRVQIVKPGKLHEGIIGIGTELVSSSDNSIAVLLGESPGASTSAHIAVQVLEKFFERELANNWLTRLKTIIPTYGIDLTQDAAACHNVRAKTAAVLQLQDI
jgi:malate dehydrogenase (quinone)